MLASDVVIPVRTQLAGRSGRAVRVRAMLHAGETATSERIVSLTYCIILHRIAGPCEASACARDARGHVRLSLSLDHLLRAPLHGRCI